MGYRRMTKEDMYAILRGWRAGQHVSGIAEVENCDRKTIRKYRQIEGPIPRNRGPFPGL